MRSSILPGALIGLLAIGCGEGSKEKAKDVKVSVQNFLTNPEQLGSWETGRRSLGLLDLYGNQTFEFAGNQFTNNYALSTSEEGGESQAQLTYSGEFTVEKTDQENVMNMDLKYQDVKLSVSNQSIADVFNSVDFCGISDWEPDSKARDLTSVAGEGMCQVGDIPSTVYELIKISDGEMNLGYPGIWDANFDDARPDEVNTNVTYTRK